MIGNSIESYWKKFQDSNPEYLSIKQPQSFYFCDKEEDANECAELVVKKIKQLHLLLFGGSRKIKNPFQKLVI